MSNDLTCAFVERRLEWLNGRELTSGQWKQRHSGSSWISRFFGSFETPGFFLPNWTQVFGSKENTRPETARNFGSSDSDPDDYSLASGRELMFWELRGGTGWNSVSTGVGCCGEKRTCGRPCGRTCEQKRAGLRTGLPGFLRGPG